MDRVQVCLCSRYVFFSGAINHHTTARQSAKLHGNPISYAKIACKIRVGHVGCLNLRVESTYTMVLFLYHCTHSLGRKISITFVYCRWTIHSWFACSTNFIKHTIWLFQYIAQSRILIVLHAWWGHGTSYSLMQCRCGLHAVILCMHS